MIVTAVAAISGCSFPQDPRGTIDEARGGEMRVGITANEPWTRVGEGEPSGVEVELIEGFAEELGAEIVWVPGPEYELVEALDAGQVDVVIAGLTKDSPSLSKHAGLTYPYYSTRLLVGASPSEGFEDASGREIAVEVGDPAASYLERRGARPVYERTLSAEDAPLAAEDWRLRMWGLEPTGVELSVEEHVMAVPMGENGLLLELERYLRAHEGEVGRLLREETG